MESDTSRFDEFFGLGLDMRGNEVGTGTEGMFVNPLGLIAHILNDVNKYLIFSSKLTEFMFLFVNHGDHHLV